MRNSEISYCGQLVRAHDPDRFLISMFAPARAREALWALFAFNHEIAKTREVVTETRLGLIRLQWWREEIAKLYAGGDPPEHEVLKPLAEIIRSHDLPQEAFETLIYGREFDLEDVLPGNMEGLLRYADFTTMPLMSLALRICGGDPGVEPVHAVAVNYALTGLLRAVPAYARQRRCYLPQDRLEAQGVFVNRLYDLKPGEGLNAVVCEVLEHVLYDVKPENRFLKASQALALIYAKALKSLDGDVFNDKLIFLPYFKELRLLLKVIL